jgi:hypothetical protein
VKLLFYALLKSRQVSRYGLNSVQLQFQEKTMEAPQELHAFHFLMAWHPRLNIDPRHLWLRGAMRSTIATLNA